MVTTMDERYLLCSGLHFIIVFVEFVTAKSLANEYIQAYISKVSI